MHSINVFQKNWAFTTADAERPQIKTGNFGPCYVVTWTQGKFAAMAHIDDTTHVDSMEAIFNKFRENSVQLKDVKVIVLGGWKKHTESFKWGEKILKKISEAGFIEVSIKNMYAKETPSAFQHLYGISRSEVLTYYHAGAMIDARNGKTFILKHGNPELEKEQERQSLQFAREYDPILGLETPLSQIL